jgi:hypothetical protein
MLSIDELKTQYGPKLIIPERVTFLNMDVSAARRDNFLKSYATSQILSVVPPLRVRAKPPTELPIVPNSFAPSYQSSRLNSIEIIQNAIDDGCKTLLFFEDDAGLDRDFDTIYAAACQDLPEDWLGLWLGGQVWSHGNGGYTVPPEELTPHLVRLRGMFGFWAQLLNRGGMKTVLDAIVRHPNEVHDHSTNRLFGQIPRFYASKREAAHGLLSRWVQEKWDHGFTGA